MIARVARGSFPAMSAVIELVGVDVPEREVARATEVGRQLAAEWEMRFSRFRPDSDLSHLNAACGSAIRVDDDVINLLETSKHGVLRTGGRFDPSVLPALEAAGYDRDIDQVRTVPHGSPGDPVRAAGLDGWERVQIDRARGEVRLPPGMRIDLGGVAKGAFVDRLASGLASWPGGCVDAGGDLRVWGRAPDGDQWIIGIEDPTQQEADLIVAHLRHRDGVGIATSGTHRRQWRAGGDIVNHLIDPRTGSPLTGDVRAATAFASSVTVAEIATKALMMAANERGCTDTFGAAMAVVAYADGHIDIVQEGNAGACSVTLADPDRRTA
jgi:FAD:protein FMN transferase